MAGTSRPWVIGETDFLVVVDMQNDFMPGGALGVPFGDQAISAVNRLARRFKHVALTQDWHPQNHTSFASSHSGRVAHDLITLPYGPQILWPDHCVQGSTGADLVPDLDIPHAELILRKGFRRLIDSYSAFYENDRRTPTGLRSYAQERGFHRIFLAGLAFDFCVRYSAEDAHRAGFTVLVVEDACRAIDVAGSLSEARASLAARDIPLVLSDMVTNDR